MSGAPDLLDRLEAHDGLICAVGAGGKKSLLRWIAAHHPGPVALTATVHTAPLADLPPDRVRLGDAGAIEAWLARLRGRSRSGAAEARRPAGPLAFAAPPDKPGRWAGLPGDAVARLHAAGGFAATLVKADGARMRLIKAPDPDEPLIPPGAATVLPLVSARCLGRPLDGRTAHRPERLGPLVGAAPGEALTPEHVGRLLAAPAGALQHAEGATVVAVINMVDSPELRRGARRAAEAALAATDRLARVLLLRLAASDPLIDAIER